MTYGNVTENSQQDVDEEISIAAALKEDTERREEDSKDDLAEVGSGERHIVDLIGFSSKTVGVLVAVVDATSGEEIVMSCKQRQPSAYVREECGSDGKCHA